MESKSLTGSQSHTGDFIKVSGELVRVGALDNWRGLIATFIGTLDTDKKASSREQYGKTLTQFFIWLQETGKSINSLTGRDIVLYSQYLQGRGLSSLTISSYLTSVKLFFSWAEAEKIYPNIAKVVKSPRRVQEHRKKHLADDKSRELLSYFSTRSLRDYAIVNLKLRCGLRNIEIIRANIEDLCLETYTDGENRTQTRQVLKLQRKGHTEKDGFVVLSPKAYEPIKAYLQNRKGAKSREPLFLCQSSHKGGEEGRLTTRSVSRLCKEGLRAIGLDGREFSAHSLRHTTACALLKHGAELADVQGVLGHANPATTQIYTKDIEEEQRLQKAPELMLDSAF